MRYNDIMFRKGDILRVIHVDNISVFLDDSKMIHSTLEKKADEVEGILDFIRGTKLIEKAA